MTGTKDRCSLVRAFNVLVRRSHPETRSRNARVAMRISMRSPTLLGLTSKAACRSSQRTTVDELEVAHGVRNSSETAPGFGLSPACKQSNSRGKSHEGSGHQCLVRAFVARRTTKESRESGRQCRQTDQWHGAERHERIKRVNVNGQLTCKVCAEPNWHAALSLKSRLYGTRSIPRLNTQSSRDASLVPVARFWRDWNDPMHFRHRLPFHGEQAPTTTESIHNRANPARRRQKKTRKCLRFLYGLQSSCTR
jgi:hypothetical protein